jgi:hypothetical protein
MTLELKERPLARVVLLVVAGSAAVSLGCASSHDLASGGTNLLGGGYYESKLAGGIYHISVKTNFAPWVNRAGARASWRNRAEALCSGVGYREVDISEGSYEQGPAVFALPYIITTRDGYAVCKNVALSDDEAMASIGRARSK